MKEIEITTGMNGYPQGLHAGFIGFDSIAEARAFADARNGEVVILHQREGWAFWESRGWTNEPFHRTAEDYGDDYRVFRTAAEYQEEAEAMRAAIAEDGATAEELARYDEEAGKVLAQFSDGVGVVTCCGQYYDTIQLDTMAYSEDTHNWAIGVEL